MSDTPKCGTCGSDDPKKMPNRMGFFVLTEYVNKTQTCPDLFHALDCADTQGETAETKPRGEDDRSEEEWVRNILQEEYERPQYGLQTPLYWLRQYRATIVFEIVADLREEQARYANKGNVLEAAALLEFGDRIHRKFGGDHE